MTAYTIGKGRPSGHSTAIGAPAALWQLNGTLADSSGNAGALALANAGKVRYTELLPGLPGVRFDGATRLGRASTDASLVLAGDVTIEMILQLDNPAPGTTGVLFNFDGFTNLQAGNSLYAVVVGTTGLSFWWERGTNVQDNWFPSPELFFPPGVHHFAVTRATDVIQFWLDGQAWGDPSGTELPPVGGTASRFFLGNSDNSVGMFPPGSCASVKVCPSALSAAEIKEEFNMTLGPFYGELP